MSQTEQSQVEIVLANEPLIPSFHAALDAVAREEIYIEMVEAKPLEDVIAFQTRLISQNAPCFYAVTVDQEVVGWIDITPAANPRMAHRGFLGMGLRKEFRGRGLGSKRLNSRSTRRTQLQSRCTESTDSKTLALFTVSESSAGFPTTVWRWNFSFSKSETKTRGQRTPIF